MLAAISPRKRAKSIMAEPEGIYGEVSETEREQLDEEGIEIMQMPWLPQDN